jgi:hypothetical protein
MHLSESELWRPGEIKDLYFLRTFKILTFAFLPWNTPRELLDEHNLIASEFWVMQATETWFINSTMWIQIKKEEAVNFQRCICI